VAFFNTGSRTILIGWMSNWQYAQVVPTETWRSAMTIPRELSLKKVNNKLFLVSKPVKEFNALNEQPVSLKNVDIKGEYNLSKKIKNTSALYKLELTTNDIKDFSIVLSNEKGNELEIGYDKQSNQYFIDRSRSGETGFEPGFARRHFAPRIGVSKNINLTLVADIASVELFADDGLTVMTDIFFPDEVMTTCTIKSTKGILLKNIKYTGLKAAKVQ
jgi:fructan beta-fructosidase